MTLKEKIAVMQHFADGGEIETKYAQSKEYGECPIPDWDWISYKYRIKQHTYPKWFKGVDEELVVKFTGLSEGTVVQEEEIYNYKVGHTSSIWSPHTDITHWVEIDEPKSYPKYFKSKLTELIVEFTELPEGVVIVPDSHNKVGYESNP